ncbi:MAG: ATP-binding protein [Marinifilaceae bacterium]
MKQQIFICGCENHGKVEKASIEKLRKLLGDNKLGYTYIEDLCGTVHKNPYEVEEICNLNNAVIFGCQPRAMQKLIAKFTGDSLSENISFFHVEDESTETLVAGLENDNQNVSNISYQDDWKPWFPVIDYDRCTGCQKCLNFCLFGVYATDENGKVVVAEPANCKDLCPACARVCSENAIIFPKHKDSPIDGGEGEFESKEGMNILEQIQNEDVYSVLSARRSSFKTSLLKKDQFKLAVEERKACSCNLKRTQGNDEDEKSGKTCC